MNYQVELNFVRELLKTYRLNLYLFDDKLNSDIPFPEYNWIGEILTKEASFSTVFQTFKKYCTPNVIYQVEDGFLCHHIVFLFPFARLFVSYLYYSNLFAASQRNIPEYFLMDKKYFIFQHKK